MQYLRQVSKSFCLSAAADHVIARLPTQPPSLVFSRAAATPSSSRDVGLTLRFTVGRNGFAAVGGAPDLAISATAGDFPLLLARREDPDTLFFAAW